MDKISLFFTAFLVITMTTMVIICAIIYFLIDFAITNEKTNFNDECLNEHNWFRERHYDTEPLVLDKHLIEMAEEMVDQTSKTKTGQQKTELSIGQNEWVNTEVNERNSAEQFASLKCETPVDQWYNDMKYYVFGVSWLPTNTMAKKFTQIVWKSTKLLGCAKSYNKTGVYVICLYSPKGNLPSGYDENVGKRNGKII